MTRKDFEMIARVIRALGHLDDQQHEDLAVIFADALAPTNPRFNRERFLIACGVLDKSDHEAEEV